jgi:hypothetical protein
MVAAFDGFDHRERPLVLSQIELRLLWARAGFEVSRSSPLAAANEGPYSVLAESLQPRVESAVRRLTRRGLINAANDRLERDLLRRLLILSQPEGHLVLEQATPMSGVPRSESYFVRAGAYMRFDHDETACRLGLPSSLASVVRQLVKTLAPRASFGDFIDVVFDASEYAVLVLASRMFGSCGAESGKKEVPSGDVDVFRLPEEFSSGSVPDPMPLGSEERQGSGSEGPDLTVEPGKWLSALTKLEEKRVVRRIDGGWSVRSFWLDLIRGLVSKQQRRLSFADFGEQPTHVRQAILVALPGSTFFLKRTQDSGLLVREFDEPALVRMIHRLIGPSKEFTRTVESSPE